MRVDVGNNISYITDYSTNTLPKVSEAFESILNINGRGQLVEASFKFNSEKVLFNLVIDGENLMEFDLKQLKAFQNYDEDAGAAFSSVSYFKETKVLMIKFSLPIQYSQSIEFLAKTNDNNRTKQLRGYIVIVNKDVE